MYQTVEYQGKKRKAMLVPQAAIRLGCGLSTIRKYLQNGNLEGILIFDEKINRLRQYVFFDSIYEFTPPRYGRAKGSLDKTTDHSKRKKAAQNNGRLGGLANLGQSKKKFRKLKKQEK